jgi:hypothetical protein
MQRPGRQRFHQRLYVTVHVMDGLAAALGFGSIAHRWSLPGRQAPSASVTDHEITCTRSLAGSAQGSWAGMRGQVGGGNSGSVNLRAGRGGGLAVGWP